MLSCRFWMNCFLVLSYINILRHYLTNEELNKTQNQFKEIQFGFVNIVYVEHEYYVNCYDSVFEF